MRRGCASINGECSRHGGGTCHGFKSEHRMMELNLTPTAKPLCIEGASHVLEDQGVISPLIQPSLAIVSLNLVMGEENPSILTQPS